MKATREYAEKSAKKHREKTCNSDADNWTVENCEYDFTEGFMTAIEETNHIEVLEALKTSTKWLKLIISLPIKQDIRDVIEAGIKLNNEAIRKAEEELKEKA